MCVEFHRSEFLKITSHFETIDSWKVWSNGIAWSHTPLILVLGGVSQGYLYALETSFIYVVSFRPVITPQWDPVSRKINVIWGGRISLSSSIGESTQEDVINWYLRTWESSSCDSWDSKTILCWKKLMGMQKANIHGCWRNSTWSSTHSLLKESLRHGSACGWEPFRGVHSSATTTHFWQLRTMVISKVFLLLK